MEVVSQLKRGLSRQFSTGSLKKNGIFSFKRQTSFDPRLSNASRFVFGRQSSLDPNRRSPIWDELAVPENLDSTMQLLFLACQGDAKGVAELMKEGIDVNSIDLDGRTALHIAASEGHVEVVKLLLNWKANIEARDRWGSTAAADAKFYGNVEVYNLLKARGAKLPKTRKTPMAVSNPKDVPDYEVNPTELQFRRGEDIFKNTHQVAKWNGTKVVVKILDKDNYSDPECINAFKHELSLLLKVRHPNVVQFLGAVTQNTPLMIISEYHPKGNLGSYLQKKGRLPLHKVLKFAIDIARGMNYLHECKPDPIIHCNLKPKHILMDAGDKLKVAGFGLIKLSKVSLGKAKLAHPMSHVNKLSVYMAPEVYKNEIFDRKVDAFSFGLILYEMLDGAPPFHPTAPEQVVKMICLEGIRPPLKFKSKSCPSALRELIEECWSTNPIIRPTFAEIIVRLNKIHSSSSKQGRWKGTFKLPWI
ncbi:dual specificity protein kinase shkC-like [Phalaenopsis equestris]|uniref:dual specificity protein kinase shkC-like n=1 Tax=Phalaenopsis equestris TaxID=78828 RepID=UPI0009E57C8E|nr:dual specificity protein kinase shkC-like [Phalaenopsis equestris]XP_020593345.1 dual specificity protein kinase shkC-like [Phalaenopsis equestris]